MGKLNMVLHPERYTPEEAASIMGAGQKEGSSSEPGRVYEFQTLPCFLLQVLRIFVCFSSKLQSAEAISSLI